MKQIVLAAKENKKFGIKRKKDFTSKQKEQIIARGNPPVDNNVVRGYN